MIGALDRWAARRDGWEDGRYRLRTLVRTRLPRRLGWLSRPGPGDCGNHEWHNADGVVDRCYHCPAERPRRQQGA